MIAGDSTFPRSLFIVYSRDFRIFSVADGNACIVRPFRSRAFCPLRIGMV